MAVIAEVCFLIFPIFVSALIADIGEIKSKNTKKKIASLLVLNLVLDQLVFFLAMKRTLMFSFFLKLWRYTASYQQIVTAAAIFVLEIVIAMVVGYALRRIYGQKNRYKSISIRQRGIVLLSVTLSGIPVFFGMYYGYQGVEQLSIVEICRKQAIEEENKNISYYCICNHGKYAYQLHNLFLSTDDDDLMQYKLPEITIAPQSSEIITVDSETAVEIKKKGGSIVYLSTSYGKILDQIEVPPMEVNTAYALLEDQWQLIDIGDEKADEQVIVASPVFSVPGGFYGSSIEVKLSGDSDTTIYYTVDGSVPTETSTKYLAPVLVYDRSAEANRYRSIQNVREEYLSHREIGKEPVDKAFTLRAVAIDKAGNCSDVVTQSYFIDSEKYKSALVISLIADPDDLFGEDGIYVTGKEYEDWYARKQKAELEGATFEEERPDLNYRQRGIEWERPANLEMFKEGDALLNQNVGIRIQGNSSRNYFLKRFSVYARKEYGGSNVFDTPVMNNKDLHSFVLRGGFDNAFSHKISEGRDVATLDTVPVVVFLNGEYWYDTYLEAKYNTAYLAESFQVEKNNVEILQIGTMRNEEEETRKKYEDVLRYLTSTDFSDEAEYEALQKVIDIQSYIDYSCLSMYLGNADYFDIQNTCIWRTMVNEKTIYGDGRWRWALYDMDLDRSWNRGTCSTDAQINPFSSTGQAGLPALNSDGSIFASLKRNQDFCRQFVISFMDIVNTNFSAENVTEQLEQWGEDISYDDYFFRDRAGYVTGYLADEFRLSGSLQKVTIHMEEPSAGKITLNTITPDLSEKSWSGSYYTDYPITLSVKESAGQEFGYWMVDGKKLDDKEIEIKVKEGGSEIYAVFKE